MTKLTSRNNKLSCQNIQTLSKKFDMLKKASMANNTRIAYNKGWQRFARYCSDQSVQPYDATPDNVANFFMVTATQLNPKSEKYLSLGTLELYRSAINKHYADLGKVSPATHNKVAVVLKGLARLRGNSPRQVKALREHHITAMLANCSNTLIGKRDAAILAIGFAGALRRSEICELKTTDIETAETEGIILHIRKSKTDQLGIGQRVAIPQGKTVKPIVYLQNWLLAISQIEHTKGYLFQTMRRGGKLTGLPLHHSDIPRLVKHYVASINLNPKEYSAHSLRAGFVTSAAAHHARLDKIMDVTRHTNPATVMKYIRDSDAFTDHAGASFL